MTATQTARIPCSEESCLYVPRLDCGRIDSPEEVVSRRRWLEKHQNPKENKRRMFICHEGVEAVHGGADI